MQINAKRVNIHKYSLILQINSNFAFVENGFYQTSQARRIFDFIGQILFVNFFYRFASWDWSEQSRKMANIHEIYK